MKHGFDSRRGYNMKILAIETSCDDTGVALVDISHARGVFRVKVLKNLIASQAKEHRKWGGVVPNIAKREHAKNLPILMRKIFGKSQTPDSIAVTVGPGLEPALWTGITFAKQLSKYLRVPLIGVNHLEGHLFSFLLAKKTKISNFQFLISKQTFPAIALIVSGGNTMLVKIDSLKKWKVLGETRDDAVGEAFDKVARMLKLPYPGGSAIEKLSKKGNPNAIQFPRPMLNQQNYNFSFAGLKTAVFYYLRANPSTRLRARADVAASFQEAAIDVLVRKTVRAMKEYDARSLFLSGGVAANALLRSRLESEIQKLSAIRHTPLTFLVAPHEFNTDNAAMIAVAGYMNLLRKKQYRLTANANIGL